MKRQAQDFGSLKVLAASAAAAVMMLVIGLPIVAAQVDAQTTALGVRLVGKALASRRNGLADRQAATATWVQLVRRDDWRIDPAWMSGMFGDAAGGDRDSRLLAVLGADGSVLYAASHARPLTWSKTRALEVASAKVVHALRDEEAARALHPRHPGPSTSDDWLSRQSDALMDGTLYHFVANVIDPGEGTLALRGARAPILLQAASYPADILPGLREQLELPDVTATPGSAHDKAGFLAMRNADGRIAGMLTWTPRLPGTRLLRKALMPLLLSVCGLGVAMTTAFRGSLASARALNASEARAKHLAFHDQLTELANRRLLLEHLSQAVARAQRNGGELAVLLIDLDRFKFINDTYGHQSGDELIQEVARRLVRSSRAGDICARLGGDEFVIMADACSAAEAGVMAQRVLKRLTEPVHLSAATVHTAGSIGIGVYGAGGLADADDLLRQADLALYRVKEHGRGHYCFFETEMDSALQSRRGLEGDLRDALRKEVLKVVYQPQFENGVVTAVEALARWTHPERGAVSPTFFIPLAEECGLIEELGLYVLRRAFADSARWPELRVAINLSPVQLRSPTFLTNLQILIEATGVSPERFELELTESMLLADDIHTQHTLAALRGLGFSLALDDFGTGYSSLSYLRKFPIDKIKIDRSFIAGLPDDKVSESVVRAVVRLGRALNLRVVAEGVETEDQRRRLAAVGCRSLQGFLTGRPVDAEEILIDHWIEESA